MQRPWGGKILSALLARGFAPPRLRPVVAEQLARAVEVLQRLLLFAPTLGDLGEALEVAALLDRAALALGPFEACPEPVGCHYSVRGGRKE